MLFMLIVKASKNSKAGNLPSPELIEVVTKYNEDLVKPGIPKKPGAWLKLLYILK